jgi:hypothetical protein
MSKQFARDRVNKGAELPVPAKSFSEIAATQPVLYNGSNIFNVYDKQHIMRQIDKPQYTVHPS